jgi:hypothetical protein
MNQEFLDERIGTPPPAGIDVDQIIARQRRRGVVRWSGSIGAVAAAAAALVVAMNLMGAAGPRQAAPAAPSPSPTPSATPTGVRIAVDTPDAIEHTKAWLRTALEQAVAAHAPQVSWIYMPDVPGETPLADGHPSMWVTKDPVAFSGRSGITDATTKGGFYLWLRPAGCRSAGGPQVCYTGRSCGDEKGGMSGCAAAKTPDGLEVVSWTEKYPASSSKQYVFYSVQVKLRPDYYLTVLVVNYFGGDASPVSAKLPVLTQAQLQSIAGEIADQIIA